MSHEMPASFSLSTDMRMYGVDRGIWDCELEFQRFKIHRRFDKVDNWPDAWFKWVNSENEFRQWARLPDVKFVLKPESKRKK